MIAELSQGLVAPFASSSDHGGPGIVLIAHGSRRDEANQDLRDLARRLGERGIHRVVASFLELADPDIVSGGRQCVALGANPVLLVPYFLSPGRHVTSDLEAARLALSQEFPTVLFRLAKPLGPHPWLDALILQRAYDCLKTSG